MRDADAPTGAGARALDAAGLAALAFAVAMFRIGHKSIWYDESVSADYAGRSLGGLLEKATGGDPNMAFYYVLLALWRRAFGDSEVALRSMSAVATAGAVVAVYLLGSRLFGRRTGVFAGALVALNAFMVEYAQMMRGYTLVACLVALSCWLFVIELERSTGPSNASSGADPSTALGMTEDGHPERAQRVEGSAPGPTGARLAYVLVSSLAVYTHYFAALVLLAQLATLLALRHRHAITPARIALALAVVALCIPAVAFARAGGTDRISWIAPLEPGTVPLAFRKLAGRSWPLAAIALLAVASAVWQLWTSRRAGVATRRARWLAFLLAWLVIPIAVAVVASFRQPVFLAQYLIVCLPAIALLMAAMLDRITPHRFGVAAFGLCALFSMWRLLVLYRLPGDEDWRATEAYVAGELRPGDRVAFFPAYSRSAFDYYALRNGRMTPRAEAADTARRVWLVIRDFDARGRAPEIAAMRGLLGDRRARSERARFAEVSVELFERLP